MNKIIPFIISWLIISDLFCQVLIDDKFETTTLENQMGLFRDSTNSMTIEGVLKNKSNLPFKLATVASPSFGYDTSHIWVHFKVKNITPKSLLFFIRIYRTSLDISEFYLCHENKIIKKEVFDWKIPFYKRKNQSKIISSQFEIDSQKQYDVFVLVAKKGNVVALPIHVLSSDAFYKLEKYEDLFYGTLIGGMFLCVLMAVFLFTLSKELIYLYYSLYVICSTITILGIGGVLMQPFGHKIRILTGPENYLFFMLGVVAFNILFTHHFFSINKKGPKWLFLLGRFVIFLCSILAIVIIYDYHLIAQIRFLYIYLLFIPILVISIIIAFIRGEVLGKFYFIAFLPLITIAFLITASETGIFKSKTFLPFLAPSLLFEIAVLLAGLAFRLYDFQRKKQKLESEMAFQNILTQETERNRIAQDLHDDVGNSLAALKNYLIQKYQNNETNEKINKIAQDLRSISHNLASINFNETTLSTAFHNLINRHNDLQIIDYELIEIGTPIKLAPEKSLVIYRIACELLNNVQKHAKANKATIQLIYDTKQLTLQVEDDGIGINNIEVNTSGIGLNHIRSRVAYLQGKLTIDDDGKGTIIIINIPI